MIRLTLKGLEIDCDFVARHQERHPWLYSLWYMICIYSEVENQPELVFNSWPEREAKGLLGDITIRIPLLRPYEDNVERK